MKASTQNISKKPIQLLCVFHSSRTVYFQHLIEQKVHHGPHLALLTQYLLYCLGIKQEILNFSFGGLKISKMAPEQHSGLSVILS